MGNPARRQLARVSPRPGAVYLARQVPGIALFLRRAGTYRYGARAFSTLEGYAGRNPETELAPPRRTPGHRPGSRLKWERRQTRSSNDRASVRFGQAIVPVQNQDAPKGARG